MINSQSHLQQEPSSCFKCRNQYPSSSSQSQSEERIVIPLKRQLLQNSNGQMEEVIRKLQVQVQSLKRANLEKQRIIDDLKRDMEHKMTHYMLFGEINRHAEELSKLKTQLTHKPHENNEKITKFDIQKLIQQQSRKQNKIWQRYHSETTQRKPALKKSKKKQQNSHPYEQYYQARPKINELKKQMSQLQKKNTFLEQELVWMSNFVCTFIKTIQRIALKIYSENIILFDWTLKKKSKVCWRYLKHILTYMFSQ